MESDWTVFASLLGLAMLLISIGILRAYRRIVPYCRGEEGLKGNPPPPMIKIFMNFNKAGYGLFAVGVALLVISTAIGPGLMATTQLSLDIPITLYFACILGLLLVVLTYNVLFHRVRAMVEEGGTDEKADRIVRVHQNFAEYVPTGLALMIALEWAGAPDLYIWVGGGLFTFARVIHAYGYSVSPMAHPGRVIGIQTTLGALAFMGISAAYFILTA